MSRPIAEVGSTASSYEILAKLATGGMAEIFLARGASVAGVERYVVLKRVLREKATDVDFLRMFLDEARLAAQLQHPHIAQVYDIGKLGDSYFFTMEYVHGETVRGLLQRAHALRRPLPIATVLTIVAGAAAGLHHAHDRIGTDGRALGIVHRDVSPSNLMVSYEGAVKVVDFGVAKAAHRSHETRAGAVKGKIAYLSPEQCRGGEIDRRSDLFSLGIVLWEMLTTERLFKRNSDFENMAAIVNDETQPPSIKRPEVTEELDAVVLKCLAKNPADRFQTADELHEALELVAVRTGSALSSAALGRLMRELFGQRPEPWIEMQTREAHPEVVTVTSEPLPAQLAVPVGGRWDLELEQVRDLSGPGLRPLRVPQDAIPTAAMPAVDPRRISQPPPMAPPSAEDLLTTLPRAPQAHHTPSQGSGVMPMRTQSPMTPYDISRSISRPQQPEPRRVPRVVFILGPAVVLGIIIGIAASLGGGQKDAAADLDASPATVMAVTHDDQPAPSVAVQPPVPAEAFDAESVGPADAAEIVAQAIDAGVRHTPDAGVKHTPETNVAATVVRKQPRPQPSQAPTVDDLLGKNKIAEAVGLCAGSSTTLAQNSSSCVIAACRAHETAKARKWLSTTPSTKRAGLATTCKAAGTQLIEPKVTRPTTPAEEACAHDPMACQH